MSPCTPQDGMLPSFDRQLAPSVSAAAVDDGHTAVEPGGLTVAEPASSAVKPRNSTGWHPFVLFSLRLVCIVVAILLWQLATATGFIPTAAVSSPGQTFDALRSIWVTGPFWSSIGSTMTSWAIGLGISVLIAVPIGMVLGLSSLIYDMFRHTIDFLRTIPPVALIPLALLLYGATAKMAIVLIVFGCVWPMLLQTMYGVHEVDTVARDVARSYRWSLGQRFYGLVLPSAAPFLATGLRITATMSLLLAIGSEIIGGAPGIGLAISNTQAGAQVAQVYAYVIVSGVLGLLLNVVLLRLERRVLRWHPAHR